MMKPLLAIGSVGAHSRVGAFFSRCCMSHQKASNPPGTKGAHQEEPDFLLGISQKTVCSVETSVAPSKRMIQDQCSATSTTPI